MFTAAYNYSRQKTYNFFNDDDKYARDLHLAQQQPARATASSAAASYQLPFGKGRRLLADADPVVNAVLGGWSLSAMTTHEFRQLPALRPGHGFRQSDHRRIPRGTGGSTVRSSARFRPTRQRTNPWQYEGLTGPRNWNLDTTLSKSFHVTERIRLEFRLEAYNLTNSFIPTDPVVNIALGTLGKSVNQANKGRELQYTLRLHF